MERQEQEEAIELARELIRLDTINPPGNEVACAELLAERLTTGGVDVAYREFQPGRRSLVARCTNPAAGRPLCLTGHLDTVPLGAADWSVDPFGAAIVGDRLYGRSVPGMDHRRIHEDLTRYLAPDLSDLSVVVDLPAVWTDPDHPWARRVFATVAEIAGGEPEPRGATFFTDACALRPAYGDAPTVILGPGEPAMAHQTDEYCSIFRIGEAVDLYRALIRDWQRAPLGVRSSNFIK